MRLDFHSQTMRDALWAMVRRRVPERDAEDVLQSVLAEAVASPHRPAEPESARRWIWGMARNKIADYHRRARREVLVESEPAPTVSDDDVQDLLRWAVGELPAGADAHRTFEWLLREGEGEKLEEIAQSEQLSAAQVRQRVSRLRRHFRTRWAAYAAALGILVVAWMLIRRSRAHEPTPWIPMVQPIPERVATLERARQLRYEGLQLCTQQHWNTCLERLDAARALDPAGDDAQQIRAAREAANRERHHETPTGPREPGMPSTVDSPRDSRIYPATTPDVISDAFGFGGTGTTGTGLGGGSSDVGSVLSPRHRSGRAPVHSRGATRPLSSGAPSSGPP